MIELYSPSEIRAAEIFAMENGVSEIELMRRAAEGILQALPKTDGAIGILCGKGNNAGDGYALAHLLSLNGRTAILYRFSEKLTPAAAHYYELCKTDGVPERVSLEDNPFPDCSLLVDCLFGTGFHGEVASPFREVIEAANESRLPIVAADIPSGLSAESGLGTVAIRAVKNVAIGGYKYGHFLGRARDLCGELTVCDIGLAPLSDAAVVEDSDLYSLLAPRPHHCHKGTYGTVTLLGGSLPYSGAPRLSALAAASLRSGCGIARLALPACIANAALPYLLEGTLCPMPCRDGRLIYDEEALETAFQGAASGAIGMGMGRSDDNAEILRWVLENLSIPLVIDADGLNTLAEMDLSILSKTKCNVVLTPHPKEFSRLSGIPMNEVLAHPVASARSFAAEHGCTVLLKGTSTVVADGTDVLFVSRGSGGMATAGSGDVLSGVIAALLAWSQEDLLLTVAAGAHICGIAGEIAAERVGTISQVASDTVSAIPDAILAIAGNIHTT
ncbi:MAG: NAD(P)H-hydrate dehydratase [Clostridia bacterium]|nr:NAD(P)H-hydrate dehydratase [Clostridia bacterium]